MFVAVQSPDKGCTGVQNRLPGSTQEARLLHARSRQLLDHEDCKALTILGGTELLLPRDSRKLSGHIIVGK